MTPLVRLLRRAFVTGVLVLVPLLATIEILRWLIRTLEENARHLPPNDLPFDFRGLGIVVALGLIFVVGILTQNYVGKVVVKALDSGLRRVALVGGLYSSIKKFLEMIFSPQDGQFHGVVLVPFPRPGMYSIAFRTGAPHPKIAKKIAPKQLVNVFIPLTPNPTSGFYLLVEESELVPLEMSVQDAFKAVISLGIVAGGDRVPDGDGPSAGGRGPA